MKKEEIEKEILKIQKDYYDYQDLTKKRIFNFLNMVGEELGNYFISKGFIHVIQQEKRNFDYYYDPKTKVGIRIEIPSIDLTRIEYNSLIISIVYKVGSIFLDYCKGICYYHRYEHPEKVFIRFKKYNGKAGTTRLREYLRNIYPKEMLLADRADRSQKIRTINNIE